MYIKSNKAQKKTGFTIVEILMTISMVGVLSTLSVSSWNTVQQKNIRSQAKQVLYQMSLDQQQHRTRNTMFNNQYQIGSEFNDLFTLRIDTSNQVEFAARLILKADAEKADPDCKQYTLQIKNGRLNIKSAPKTDCL
jgi:prepilin-type N-terminal cleavage/methylation domain-containing protein